MEKDVQLNLGIRNLYNKMVWLNDSEMKDRFDTSSEVHCIEYIGQNTEANVTKLVESFYMTRGAISKMTKKLIKKGTVECYQKPGNKKEVYFRLTNQGYDVYKIHEKLHGQFRTRDKDVYERVTEEEFDGRSNAVGSRKNL